MNKFRKVFSFTAGMDDYISKPIDLIELYRIINS